MMIQAAALMVLLLSGCSDHCTKIADQQANIDLFRCKQENRKASDSSVLEPNRDFAQEELVRQCMRAKGCRE
jgi:outer membrane murein-binding lipoprotein Lpp